MNRAPETLERLRRAAFEKVKENAKIDPLARVKPKHRWLPGPLPVLALTLVLLGLTVGYAVKIANASADAKPTQTQTATANAKESASANEGKTGSESKANSPVLIVHVTGKVNKPGIVKVPPGSRVYDAIDAAGGLQEGADIGSLNLARPLQDGEQIAVGITPTTGQNEQNGGTKLININEADAAALEELDGVGPALAKRIVEYRKEKGRFKSLEDLQNVSGIGPNLLARIKPGATV